MKRRPFDVGEKIVHIEWDYPSQYRHLLKTSVYVLESNKIYVVRDIEYYGDFGIVKDIWEVRLIGIYREIREENSPWNGTELGFAHYCFRKLEELKQENKPAPR